MSMRCDDADGLPHTVLLLICSQIQTNHIQKAKEGSVIHKTTERRPGGGKKPFLFALHVNRGHFPIHSIFNYTEVEQEGQVSLRGEAMKAALQLNMCTREISSLPWQWEGGKGCTYRSMRRTKSLQVLWAHVILVQRHTLLYLPDSRAHTHGAYGVVGCSLSEWHTQATGHIQRWIKPSWCLSAPPYATAA